MTNFDNENSYNGGSDRDPLFSRTIKAGKRTYYLDVKRDRFDEYFVALTESKRVQDGTETERPVFEKHKIFIYREDVLKFLSAFAEATQYISEHRPISSAERRREPRPYGERPYRPYGAGAEGSEEQSFADEAVSGEPVASYTVETVPEEAPMTVESGKKAAGGYYDIEF